MTNRLKETPLKDKPMPKKEDGGLARWMEEHLGFRPFDVEW